MKLLLFITLIFSFSISQAESGLPGLLPQDEVQKIVCGQDDPVKGHMGQMGRLIFELSDKVDDVLNEESNNKELHSVIIEKAQKLRVHLSAVMVKNPSKLEKIYPGDPQKAQLIFQGYITQVIEKTIALEWELLAAADDEVALQSKKVKVASLLLEINRIVDEAHSTF